MTAGTTLGDPPAGTTDPHPRPAEPPAPITGRRLATAAGELFLALTLTGIAGLLVQRGFARLGVPPGSDVPITFAALSAALLLAGALVLVARRSWPRWGTPAAWLLVALLNTAPLAALLAGTRYYLGGLAVDQQFRTEYLTRLTDSARLADFAYPNTPPYYPAGWFWAGGRFANLLGLPGWAAFKPWAILTMSATGVLVFVLWSLVTTRRTALLLSVATTLAGLLLGAVEPYSWLASATIPALLVLARRMLDALCAGRTGPGNRTWPTVLLLGVALGVDGISYTLVATFFAFALAVLAVVTVAVRVRSASVPAGRSASVPVGRVVGAVSLRALGVVLVATPILLLVWTPYLLGRLTGRQDAGIAARYLPEPGSQFPTPMLAGTALGVLCLAGLVWLILRGLREPIAGALATGVVAVYLWFALSIVAIAFGTTLLAFRLNAALVIILVSGAVFGFAELYTVIQGGRFGRNGRTVRLLAMVAGLATAVALVQQVPVRNQVSISNADSQYYPTGMTPAGTRDPNDLSAWIPQLTTTIADLTGRRPDQLVVLTDNWALLSVRPYWSFQASTPHYADPLGNFDARRAEIARWAAATSPAQLVTELDTGGFRAPDVFVLRQGSDRRLHIALSRDVFPEQPNVDYYDVSFDPAVFRSPAFTARAVGGFTVLVRHPPRGP